MQNFPKITYVAIFNDFSFSQKSLQVVLIGKPQTVYAEWFMEEPWPLLSGCDDLWLWSVQAPPQVWLKWSCLQFSYFLQHVGAEYSVICDFWYITVQVRLPDHWLLVSQLNFTKWTRNKKQCRIRLMKLSTDIQIWFAEWKKYPNPCLYQPPSWLNLPLHGSDVEGRHFTQGHPSSADLLLTGSVSLMISV